MNGIIEFFKSIGSFLWDNKGRIGLIPLLMLAWIPFIFPYSDLRAVVATTLSKKIGDGVAIDFNHVSLAMGFPIALALENFEFNAPGLPTIAADRLVASPSLTSILTQAPSGSVEAEGMFKGNVSASLSAGSKVKNGSARVQDIKTNLSGIQLGLLTDALRRAGIFPVDVQGTIDTSGSAVIDPTFETQPAAEFFTQIKSLSIPSFLIDLQKVGFGSMLTPSIQLGRVDLKGGLKDGKLVIEDFTFGQATDSLAGRVRGEIGLTMRSQKNGDGPPSVVPVLGAFDFKVELAIRKPLMDAMTKSGAGVVLLPIYGFLKESDGISRYSFGAKGAQFGAAASFYEAKLTN